MMLLFRIHVMNWLLFSIVLVLDCFYFYCHFKGIKKVKFETI